VHAVHPVGLTGCSWRSTGCTWGFHGVHSVHPIRLRSGENLRGRNGVHSMHPVRL